MRGTVVIGEGEKDNAPMLFNGEEVGDGTGPECDVAVDPIDGTTLTAKGMSNAVSVLAVSPRGSMYDPSRGVLHGQARHRSRGRRRTSTSGCRSAENIARVAKAKGISIHDVTVVLLDRPRHAQLVEEIRATGARIKFITDGDVAGAIMAARPDTGIDLLLGIGGTPEGIIAACAMKCIGGVIQGRLWPQDDDERQRALDAGHDLDPDFVLGTDDLVTGDDCFFVATGITDGELMRGVRYRGGGVHHALAGDALAQRHDPLDHRRAPALEATRFLRDRLRQLSVGAGGRSAAETAVDDARVERHADVRRGAPPPARRPGRRRRASRRCRRAGSRSR